MQDCKDGGKNSQIVRYFRIALKMLTLNLLGEGFEERTETKFVIYPL